MASAVSVIVPAWNASATLESCLKALGKQTVPPLEIVVVNDGSTDDTADIAERYGARVITLPGNMGPARARNQGAEQADGQIILFLDADVLLPGHLIERLEEYFADPSVTAVQTLYTPDCPRGGIVTGYQNFYYHHSLNRMRKGRVAVFATWCAAVRRQAFRDIGGFNESIPEPTVEDEELGYAIADSGGVIILGKSLQVTHLAQYTLRAFAARRLRMAVAQAKSGFRQVKKRLLARYMNVQDTGTHHSRWVVLSILLTLLAWLSPLSVVLLGLRGLLLFPLFILSALACHAGFFRSAARRFRAKVLPGFAVLCIFDMTVLGLGIIRGTLEFLAGRRY